MRLLYLNHYAGSPKHGMEFRPYYLAREWVRAGHEVRMVAANFSHVRATQPSLAAEVIDGIGYEWLPSPAYRGNGLGRVKNIWAYCSRLWRDADELAAWKPDAVIASSTYPMDIWPARRIARKAGAKLVFEVHDLWPLSPIELSGMSPQHPFARLCTWAEGTAYRDCDVCVSMLPKTHDYMASRGLSLSKLCIVPNGISPEEWQGEPAPLRADVAAALRGDGLVVGYAGSMGEPNALDTLLDAAALLQDAPLRFVLVGSGHLQEHLRARAASLPKVRFLDPVPKAQIPALLAGFDIAYLGWQRQSLYRFGIAPNKLMDYLMAGRAVLHSVEAGNDPVMESGCGLSVPPADARAVADGMLKLAALSPAQRAEMGARGRAHVLAAHSYPVLAQRFLDALR
ncbi:MAG: glycosyltransferase family 4 protein [Burkholderiales bacterium]|nr:glycosyltransferase family 4 protein [Burkholderiales bacterium]